MNVFEKIREKIEEKAFSVQIKQGIKEPSTFDAMMDKFSVLEIKEVINQVEQEHNNGWIACSERLPEEPFGCLVTVIDCEPVTQNEFENILPYHVGYDGYAWIDADGEEIPFEVLAWKKLPAPYQPKGE